MSLYCSGCGTENSEVNRYCAHCGAALAQVGQVGTAQRTSGMAIAALVLGLLGVSILAIIFGAVALNQVGKDPTLGGRGLAIAGLVLGIAGIAVGILVVLVTGMASCFVY